MHAKIREQILRLILKWPHYFMLIWTMTIIFVDARLHRRAQELYEVRVFEGAPIGTKATLNEAFDRALREMNSCFAQLESDLEWLDFDSDRLFFQTIAELPQNSSRPAQFAVLHLLCPQHKHSLHFSVHITRRNRHAPKFLSNDYRFYAPVNLPIGSEIGKIQVQDQDPIIYNSQVQLSIVRSTASSGAFASRGSAISSQSKDLDDDPYWEIARNGSIIIRRRLSELRLFRPYQLRILAIDFGSPQLFSLSNVTIVPVSVSQPQNVRVNIANTRYQIFQWELPIFGVPEQFRLTLRRKGELRPIYEGELEPTETMAMTRVRLPIIAQMEVSISAVDVDGETPSEAIPFQALESELHCEGQCSGGATGLPMCHYSPHSHQLEQFRDAMGQKHCLCFAGFSGAQCDRIEHCPSERLLEHYGGVDWPETAVNKSAVIPCPYNDDGRRLERKCGWNSMREEANWANATNAIGNEGKEANKMMAKSGNGIEVGEHDGGGHCRTQSSVLVHLGVLANYGQRSEQTLSGLQSVMRFLGTLLQFPAFQPQIPSAHFDAKIAEHVAQVLDSLAARNLSSLSGGGNSTELSEQVAEYSKEFLRRLPVPFSLQSASGGLQMRAWDLLPTVPTADTFVDDPIAGNGQGGFQIGLCFVQPPPQTRPRTARAICLRNATLFPLLTGHSPLLMVQIDDGKKRANKMNGSTDEMVEQNRQQNGPIVLGFRLPKKVTPATGQENYTCAQFDQKAQLWSASGIAVLSREFRPHGQILLCEVDSMIGGDGEEGIFALLPESMFRPESALLLWFSKFGTALGAALTMAICFGLLLSSAFFHRNSDPAQLMLLLSLLLLHLFHFVLLLQPQISHLPFGIPWPTSSALFSTLQLALLSFAASLALINSSIYTRIVQLELEIRKAQSRNTRLLLTLLFTIFLPLALCILTSFMDGQILVGLDTDGPQLQPFNWTFGMALLLPLVLFMGSAMGLGAYSFWYGNKLASSSSADWPLESASLLQRRLLHQLSCAGGLSWLILLFPFANILTLLQHSDPIRSLVLCVFYFFTALSLLLFVRILARIHRRLPYTRGNVIDQCPRALRENTLVAPLDEKGRNGTFGNENGRNGGAQHGKQPVLIIQEQGQAQPIAPGEIGLDPNNNNHTLLGSPMTDQGLDRQFLLRRAVQPSQLQSSQPPSLMISSGQFRQQQLIVPPSSSNQQRLSGTVSTSAGTVLLESDDLASLDRAIAAQTQLVPVQNSRNLPANLFAEMDGFDEDEDDEEDLDAFLEQPNGPMGGGEMSLRTPQQQGRRPNGNVATNNGSSPNNLAHPLVSVV